MNNLFLKILLILFFYCTLYTQNVKKNKSPLPDSLNIATTSIRFSPIGNNISDSIMEIKIPRGFPDYHFFYYNTNKKIFSQEYDSRLAVDSLNLIIACIGKDKIEFFDIFSDSLLLEYPVDGLEPKSFIPECYPITFFDKKGNFHLKYECRNNYMENKKDSIVVVLKKIN